MECDLLLSNSDSALSIRFGISPGWYPTFDVRPIVNAGSRNDVKSARFHMRAAGNALRRYLALLAAILMTGPSLIRGRLVGSATSP